ncbi:hypothetical protein CR152_28775 [Massilia violaceinigra]|uniref:Uncharacterized protein n=1 Tax=Massilia violaceinigra TaxID=2045208 RepID=A0A2D2DSW4_9BURK|nr:hypothetical protein [Massilia violaceinigra]ATQ78057.1 hypothetical protein CR152_28775 [Massilia violaceinigra]
MKPSRTQDQPITLHRIEIASPCTASWDKMTGNDRVRHCKDCNKNVFNLSAMPATEAAALLAENHNGDLCVRFYQRQDGTVMTSDCSDSPRAAVRQAWRKLPGIAGAAVLALSAVGCTAGDAPPGSNDTAGAPTTGMFIMGEPPGPAFPESDPPPASSGHAVE